MGPGSVQIISSGQGGRVVIASDTRVLSSAWGRGEEEYTSRTDMYAHSPSMTNWFGAGMFNKIVPTVLDWL